MQDTHFDEMIQIDVNFNDSQQAEISENNKDKDNEILTYLKQKSLLDGKLLQDAHEKCESESKRAEVAEREVERLIAVTEALAQERDRLRGELATAPQATDETNGVVIRELQKRNRELEEVRIAMEQQIEEYKLKRSSPGEAQQSTQELEPLQKSCADLSVALENEKKESAQKSAEITALKAELEAASKAYNDVNYSFDQAKKEVEHEKKENEALKSSVSVLNNDIVSLKQEVAVLTTRKESLEKELEYRKEITQEKEGDSKDTMEKMLQRLEEQNQTIEKFRADNLQKDAEWQAKENAYKSELEKKSAQVESLQKEKEHLGSRCSEFEQELKNVREEHILKSSELVQVQGRLKEVESSTIAEIATLKIQCRELAKEKDCVSENIKELTAKLDEEKRAYAEQLEKERGARVLEVNELNKKIEESAALIENERSALQKHVDSVTALQKQCHEKDEIISANKQSIESLSEKIKDLSVQVENKAKVLQEKETEFGLLQSKLSDADAAMSGEKKKLDEVTNKYQDQVQLAENITKECESLKQSNALQEETITELHKSLKECNESKTTIANENHALSEQIVSLQSAIDEEKKKGDELAIERGNLQQSLMKKEEAFNEEVKKNEMLASELSSKEEQLTSLAKRLEEKSGELSDLSGQLDSVKKEKRQSDEQVDKLNQEQIALKQQIDKAKQEFDESTAAQQKILDEQQAAIEKMAADTVKIEESFKMSQNEVGTLKAEKEKLSFELESKANKIAEIESTVVFQAQSIKELEDKNSELERASKDIQEKLAEKESFCEVLQESIEAINKQYKEAVESTPTKPKKHLFKK